MLLFTGVMAFLAVLSLMFGVFAWRQRNPLAERLEQMRGGRRGTGFKTWWRSSWRIDLFSGDERLAAEAAALGALLAGGLSFMAAGSFFALPLGGAAGFFYFPRLYGMLRRGRLQEAFANELGPGVRALARGLRGGASLAQAFAYAARETGGVVGDEFRRVVEESRGGSIAAAVGRLAARVDIPEAWMLADAVRMLGRTGGQDSLSLLEACADEIAARRARVRRASAQTAGIRFEGFLASVIPVAMFLWFFFSFGDDYRVMVETARGRMMLAVAVASLVVCWALVLAILRRAGTAD
ncbi:type II secretion system F family protein [Neomoorella thermoacetica]|uniref:type II secretion system F family protein n=1 Tax=Neomoorella thermoacetica TaxID=1525 RepID=UPI0008FB6BC7|nr:type II secretion system F family protein [Moorella thermoacetica]APC08618.1 bacterial type II secretion system protein F domain protein [Moorella thermoacetica]